MDENKHTYIDNSNGAYIEDLYTTFKENPDELDIQWQRFFEGFEYSKLSDESPTTHSDISNISNKEISVSNLIHAYRSRGHLIADTNPVRERRSHKADLALSYFNLTDDDLEQEFEAGHLVGIGKSSLRDILSHLNKTYCESISVEFMYCRNDKLRDWLILEMESCGNSPNFSDQEKLEALDLINRSVSFESFLQKKYVGKKRFSLEGLESLIPSLHAAIELGADLDATQFTLGMAHRGRLNVLVNIFQKSYEDVFSEFEETQVSDDKKWNGDVKYHLGQSADIVTKNGHDAHIRVVPNPSHLEAVNPVVEGIVYAKSQLFYDGDSKKIIPILIHGDAAFAGQGVNYEVANISNIEGYKTGGTVHIILNNQIGFTADYLEARSSVYCTDIAKVTESPVFHVNADDPLAVIHATQLAVKIRQEFGIDVYIDILGYRRYGHNEGDEPRFTQPKLYAEISKHPNIWEVFLNRLVKEGVISREEGLSKTKHLKDQLQEKLDFVRVAKPKLKKKTFERHWQGLREPNAKDFIESIDTSSSKKALDLTAKSLTKVPDSFSLFSKMKKLMENRKKMYFDKGKVDWAMGELLAFGTLLIDGHPVRLSGQDCQRGTFSHRHAIIKDVENESLYSPLNHITAKQAHFECYNSLLSEYCVLGFEYGYTTASPQALCIWEAQFGDFSNGAQIIIDQFIASSETKWERMTGLVMLLPHGYEGQGPEHSSARIERYLQLCAEQNMYVVNVSTPANYFHVLRRQIINPFRKPLIVFSPKSLLRHPDVYSDVDQLSSGKFEEVIDDTTVEPKAVKRVLLCAGKVYYDLVAYKQENNCHDVAIVRLEQYYPIPEKQLTQLSKRYSKAKWVWVQEEPLNAGAWGFLKLRMDLFPIKCVARAASASPATGNSKVHNHTQAGLIQRAFKQIKE